MKVVYQKNDYECGICVITSIYNYLFGENIEKDELILNNNLANRSLSIFEFETICKKININIESYKLEIDQLYKIKYKDYFVTTFSNDDSNFNHYVIAKKTNYGYKIFDSMNGEYALSVDEFQKFFTGVFIIFSPINSLNCEISFDNIKFFDLPKLNFFKATIIIFDVLILIFSYIGSHFLKIYLSISGNTLPKELFFISIFFIFIFLINFLLETILKFIKFKKIQELNKRNLIFYLNYIDKKSLFFFQKTPKNKIYEYQNDINKIIIYKYIRSSEAISDSIFLFILFFILIFISPTFIFFGILFIFTTIIFAYSRKKYNIENYEKNTYIKNDLEINFYNFYNFLEKEKNIFKLNKFKNKIESSFWKLLDQTEKNTIFHSMNEFWFCFVKKITFVITISILLVKLIVNNNLNYVQDLLFIISIINMFNNSISNILDYFLDRKDIEKSKNNLNDFLHSYNKSISDEKMLLDINKDTIISLNNFNFSYNGKKVFKNNLNINIKNETLVIGKNGSGKSTLLKCIGNLFEQNSNDQILIDSISIQKFEVNDLNRKIFYLSGETKNFNIDISSILNKNNHLKNEISNLLRNTTIFRKEIDSMSKGETQLLNLIELMDLENSLILLDEPFSHISDEILFYYLDNFFTHIVNKNMVIVCSHKKEVKKYFKYEVNLDEL